MLSQGVEDPGMLFLVRTNAPSLAVRIGGTASTPFTMSPSGHRLPNPCVANIHDGLRD